MQKVSVTYRAPKGDAKVATLYGHTFHDGKAEEVEVSDEVLDKIKNNSAFEVAGHSKDDKHKAR